MRFLLSALTACAWQLCAALASVSSGALRLSIGIEHADDLMADLEQALAAV